MRLLQNRNSGQGGATVAQVTFSGEAGYGALSSAEERGFTVFAPRGIAYRPCEGDNLLLIPADGKSVCAGVLSAADGIGAGELRLTSAGGAVIHLRADGSIMLNGLTITKNGELLAKSAKEAER